MQWLLENNEEWKKREINLEIIRQNLQCPTLVDNSITVDGTNNENNNIESTESFHVFFPDGTMSTLTGGQESIDKFRELVRAAAQSGYDIAFQTRLVNQSVLDYKDNNLVHACLLQYPYGRGGLSEQRLQPNGSFTCATDITDYVRHLSRLSQPHFHHELFCLILYNLAMKQAMVRKAGWRVRNKADAASLAGEITMDDVTDAINSRVRG
jgi:hypothetical protein